MDSDAVIVVALAVMAVLVIVPLAILAGTRIGRASVATRQPAPPGELQPVQPGRAQPIPSQGPSTAKVLTLSFLGIGLFFGLILGAVVLWETIYPPFEEDEFVAQCQEIRQEWIAEGIAPIGDSCEDIAGALADLGCNKAEGEEAIQRLRANGALMTGVGNDCSFLSATLSASDVTASSTSTVASGAEIPEAEWKTVDALFDRGGALILSSIDPGGDLRAYSAEATEIATAWFELAAVGSEVAGDAYLCKARGFEQMAVFFRNIESAAPDEAKAAIALAEEYDIRGSDLLGELEGGFSLRPEGSPTTCP